MSACYSRLGYGYRLSINLCSYSKKKKNKVWREKTRLTSQDDWAAQVWRRAFFSPPHSRRQIKEGSARGVRKKMFEKDWVNQLRSLLNIRGMLLGYSLGLIAEHLLLRARLWPSVYEIAGTRTRINLFDIRLIQSRNLSYGDFKGLTPFRWSLLFSSSLKKTKEGGSVCGVL